MITYCERGAIKHIEPDIINYPDGTFKINLFTDEYDFAARGLKYCTGIDIYWRYGNESELVQLIYITKALRQYNPKVKLELYMPYVPNARMDRTHSTVEVFTLKYFCDIINYLDFNRVYVLDAHSNVGPALLNNCLNLTPKELIQTSMRNKFTEDDCLFFPDEGSFKRYYTLFPQYKNVCFGIKKRDWETGEIKGLDIQGTDPKDKNIFIIDDICSYGGTVYYSVEELVKRGCKNINVFFTHTENSILEGKLMKLLEDGIISNIFTTDSIFNPDTDVKNIHVIEAYELLKRQTR